MSRNGREIQPGSLDRQNLRLVEGLVDQVLKFIFLFLFFVLSECRSLGGYTKRNKFISYESYDISDDLVTLKLKFKKLSSFIKYHDLTHTKWPKTRKNNIQKTVHIARVNQLDELYKIGREKKVSQP